MTLPEPKHTQGKAIFGTLTVLFAGSLATDTQAQCSSLSFDGSRMNHGQILNRIILKPMENLRQIR